MQFSQNTISILKNFASINTNMVFAPGHKIATVSEAKNIVAYADIIEDIPQEFGIYDMTEFLAAMSMLSDPTIDFVEGGHSLLIKDGAQKIKYRCSDIEILTSTGGKVLQLPSVDLTFDITGTELAALRKAASTLKVNDLLITPINDNTGIMLSITDKKNSSSNSYSIVIDGVATDSEFEYVFSMVNLNKFIPGDYRISVSKQLISKCENLSQPLTYFVSLVYHARSSS